MENIGKLRSMTSIYLTCDDKILLLYRQGGRVVNDVWVGSAGGHFEEQELNDAKACVLRELKEEMSITEEMLWEMELRYISLRRTKGEIRQNYYFFAKLPNGTEMDIKSNEGKLKWFSLEELNSLKMPFTSQYVMKHYVETGRHNHKMYGGVADGRELVLVELPEF